VKPADVHYAWRGWILGALFAVLALARWRSPHPIEPLGLIPFALGVLYRFQAGRYIPGHSNSRRLSGKTLALGGPYRFGRHPLYLSNLAIIAGLILFANCLPAWGAACLFGTACAHHAVLARTEERYLASRWGETYLSYLRVTPRWFGPLRGPAKNAPGPGAGSDRAVLAVSWRRQGANLGKGAVCVLILWILAAGHR
jgi:protein-S-isoprenylcysteine O-methyltransferase Ste14